MSLVTDGSNSTYNGKNIYREVAKDAKDVKNKRVCLNARSTRFPSRPSRLGGSKFLVPA